MSLNNNFRTLLVLFTFTLLWTTEPYAAPGDRDLTFGVDGIVTLDFGGG